MEWTMAASQEALWRGALALIPMALVVGVVSRFLPARPSTRHLLWLTVLLWPLATPFLPNAPPVRIEKFHPQRLSNWIQIAQEKIVGGVLPLARTKVVETATPAGVVGTERIVSERQSGGIPVPPTGRIKDVRSIEGRRDLASQSPDAVVTPAGSEPPIRLARTADPRGPVSSFYQQPAAVESGKGVETKSNHVLQITNDEMKARRREGTEARKNDELRMTNDEIEARRDGEREQGFIRGAGETAVSGTVAESPATLSERAAKAPVSQVNEYWGTWVAVAATVREAVVSLPPVPVRVWIGGAVILLSIGLIRVSWFRRLLRSAVPASAEVRRSVRHAAIAFGVSRVPEVLMTNRRVSPMVWCGRRLRLILPASLWEQLDESGRHAVIFHEMAHIKRRDHWVTWAETGIGLLYWWHPLVWWVRGRLHAEAELSCDAWVTTLLPRGRRAYAEALLTAKQFLRTEVRRTPAMTIGVTTGRAARFARRITMVMTKSVKPGLSLPGLALVAAVAVTAWLTSPALSCPEKERKQAKEAKVDATPKPDCHVDCTKEKPCQNCLSWAATGMAVGLRDCKDGKDCKECKNCPGDCAKCGECCAKAAARVEAQGGSTFERHLAQRHGVGPGPVLAIAPGSPALVRPGHLHPIPAPRMAFAPMMAVSPLPAAGGLGLMAIGVGDDDDPEDEGDDDDDDNGDELEARMNRLERQLERMAEHMERLSGRFGHGPEGETPTPPTPPQMRGPKPPKPPKAARAPKAPDAPRAPRTPREPKVERDGGGDAEWQSYQLPAGKLEALMGLMARDDVPVLVRAEEGGIGVQGPRRVQRVFGAFINLIHPGGDGRSDDGDDDDSVGASGGPDFDFDFDFAHDGHDFFDHEKFAKEMAKGHWEDAAKLADQIRKQVSQNVRVMTKERRKAIQDQRKVIEHRMREVHENAMKMRHKAQEMREKAERIREGAERLRQESEELRIRREQAEEDDERTELETKITHLASQAGETEGEAGDVEQGANGMEREADVVELEITALEAQLADLDRQEQEIEAEQERVAQAIGQ